MSGATSDGTGLVATRSWKLRHSLWLLAPLLGVGVLSFVGFVYCAIRVKERKWTVLASISVLLTVVAWIFLGTWTDPSGNLTSAAGTYLFELWIVSIIFAVIVNRDYLAWRGRAGLPRQSGAFQTGSATSIPDSPHVGGFQPVPYGIPGRPESSSEQFISPGYYDDPQSPQLIRWWNGYIWTDKTAPRPPRHG